jgi:hypothetical protein
MEKATLSQILDRLRAIGDDLKEAMDYSAIAPEDGHHRSVMFIRLPYPPVAAVHGEVFERLSRLMESLNRPDTMKVDVYTVVGRHILSGFQPHTELTADGDFDPEDFHAILSNPYVLQIVVDVVQPDAMEQTLNALSKEK